MRELCARISGAVLEATATRARNEPLSSSSIPDFRGPRSHARQPIALESSTYLVDDQQIAAGDPRAALARHLVAAGDVDHVDDEVGQLAAVVGRQVVAARLDQQQVGGEAGVQRLQRLQIGADVLAHRRVRAAARLDGRDARRRQGGVAGQEFGVFAGWEGEVLV